MAAKQEVTPVQAAVEHKQLTTENHKGAVKSGHMQALHKHKHVAHHKQHKQLAHHKHGKKMIHQKNVATDWEVPW